MQTDILASLNDINQDLCQTILSCRVLIPEGSYMTRLSTTEFKRLENAIAGAHLFAGRTTGSQPHERLVRLGVTEFPD